MTDCDHINYINKDNYTSLAAVGKHLNKPNLTLRKTSKNHLPFEIIRSSKFQTSKLLSTIMTNIFFLSLFLFGFHYTG